MSKPILTQYLDFEKPVVELENRVEELRRSAGGDKSNAELARLEKRLDKLRRDVYDNLSPWHRTLIARHPARPYFLDYLQLFKADFTEIHGDRAFGDDPAIVAGLAILEGRKAVVVGHQKGRNVKENVLRNFGMPNPEGYRKALRAMRLAEKFGKPLLTFIDTPGAHPGLGAEERGQAEAIAHNIYEMFRLRTPIVSVVIGEGGSGGALALGIGDRVYMMENSWYSVISPEGCASILWRDDKSKAAEAAAALRLDAASALELGIIDGIVPEPEGGAHRDPQAAADLLKDVIFGALEELRALSSEQLIAERYAKFRSIGHYIEKPLEPTPPTTATS